MFEVDRIYCSDITGLGVRPFPDLVFEVDRILHKWTFPSFGLQIPYLDSGEITMITLNRNSTD